MSTKIVQPVSKQATEDYHRFGDKKADKLIDAFAAATDEDAARADERPAGAVQQGRARRPAVHQPWGAYTDARFTGWPTEENPYATLGNRNGSTILVLTSLKPVKS